MTDPQQSNHTSLGKFICIRKRNQLVPNHPEVQQKHQANGSNVKYIRHKQEALFSNVSQKERK